MSEESEKELPEYMKTVAWNDGFSAGIFFGVLGTLAVSTITAFLFWVFK